ncbi:hypothetical protein BC829DRAFT_398659 [Chytridium lagenaria]|nr:hypothetical protein BC829DRAFT_398659 [Chytridium lagenaria]
MASTMPTINTSSTRQQQQQQQNASTDSAIDVLHQKMHMTSEPLDASITSSSGSSSSDLSSPSALPTSHAPGQTKHRNHHHGHHHGHHEESSDLEKAIEQNHQNDGSHLFASLATVKAYGRPANRFTVFRGFLSDMPLLSTTTTLVEKINNTLIFAADARSGSVDDLIHGSRFGEVCWLCQEPASSSVSLENSISVVSPDHPLALSHRVPVPFSSFSGPGFHSIDWEAKRLDVWRRLSSVRRASFAWPAPGKPQQQPLYVAEPESQGNNATSLSLPIVTHLDADPVPSDHTHQVPTTPTPTDDDPYTTALRNFCLLLLDVDGADHLRMAQVPHVRTKFRRSMESWSEDHLEDLFLNYGSSTHHRRTSPKHSREGSAEHHHHHHHHGHQEHGHGVESLVKKVAHWSIKEVNPEEVK